MVALSRYWHTLGWVYFRKGDFEKARLYVEAAWNLEPRAYYGGHLGRIYEDQGNTKTAITVPGGSGRARLRQRGAVDQGQTDCTGRPGCAGSIAWFPFPLPGVNVADGSALFDIVLAPDVPPAVQFVGGSDSLAAVGPAIAQAGLKAGLPDAGPEKVIRRTRVSCGTHGNAGCELTLLSAEEARKTAAPPS